MTAKQMYGSIYIFAFDCYRSSQIHYLKFLPSHPTIGFDFEIK